MRVPTLALQGMETALNRLLALDGEAAKHLSQLHGQVLAIVLRGIDIRLYLVPTHDGRLRLLDDFATEPDCTIEGSPLDLLRAGNPRGGSTQFFAGRPSLHGDVGLGQRFGAILGGLDIDREELRARLVGDVAAHEIGRRARAADEQAQRIRQTLIDNLSEYLTEEARLLPHRFEIEAWQKQVEHARDDLARLAARVGLLESAE